MTVAREQESSEAIVPGATSRKTKPDGLTTREGLNLAGRHDHRWSCTGSDEADWPSYRQRSPWQRQSAASFRKDCQEPPYGVQPPEEGKIVAFPQVGGLHYRYEWRAA